MAAEKTGSRTVKKRSSGRKPGGTELAKTIKRAEPRYVDIDPWAMLVEGLMEVPEEKPAERKRSKGK
jgi:hypothetical protein